MLQRILKLVLVLAFLSGGVALAQDDDDDGPVSGPPVDGAPVGNEAIGGEPVYGEPVGNEAIGGEPVYGDTDEGDQPIGGEPLY